MKSTVLVILGVVAATAVIMFGISKLAFYGDSGGSDSGSWLGKTAPDFTLSDMNGKSYTLSSLKGKKVVLFFNEGIMCYPACWDQVAAFGSDPDFNTKDVVTLSITVDAPQSWTEAITKMPDLAKATILSDQNRTVSREYSVLSLPSSMHKGLYPGHTYFVIDRTGVIRFALDDPQMAIRNQQILSEVNKIN